MKSVSRKSSNLDERLLLSLGEAARALGLSQGFLRLEIQRKLLRAARCGRRVMISREELDRYLRKAQA